MNTPRKPFPGTGWSVALCPVHTNIATIRSRPWLCLWLSLGLALEISSQVIFDL